MAGIKTQRYQILIDNCSCRNPIGSRQKEFFYLLDSGLKGVQALEKMGVTRMCCRIQFLFPPVHDMIDRSSGRFIDDTNETGQGIIKKSTYVLSPKNPPPDFPSLPGMSVDDEKVEKIEIEPELPF